jgi:hypothetical protein
MRRHSKLGQPEAPINGALRHLEVWYLEPSDDAFETRANVIWHGPLWDGAQRYGDVQPGLKIFPLRFEQLGRCCRSL